MLNSRLPPFAVFCRSTAKGYLIASKAAISLLSGQAEMLSAALPCPLGCAARSGGTNLRRAGYSRGNTWSRKNGRFFHYQLGVLYSGQQESDTKHVEFYGHLLIAALRSKLQTSPRTF
jgi:hypothetical protein